MAEFSHPAEPVKLRSQGAEALIKKEAQLPAWSRVEIYVTGPKRGVDQTTSARELRASPPRRVIEGKGEIAQLFARVRTKENRAEKEKMRTRDGYTFPLLAYHESDGSFSHIRVLDPGEDSVAAVVCEFKFPG